MKKKSPATVDSWRKIPDSSARRRLNSSRLSSHCPTNHELPLRSLVRKSGSALGQVELLQDRVSWGFFFLSSFLARRVTFLGEGGKREREWEREGVESGGVEEWR
jgi:hypothetical protein